ncbi:MAG: sulfur oxidation c-type cytochrome SoxA [Pseudomonadota bacterium]
MTKFFATLSIMLLSIGHATAAGKQATDTTPTEDIATYRHYFEQRFPGVSLQQYANGVYAIDTISRENWEAIEEFPPYEPMVETGETLWNTPFANGKTYADCFGNDPAQRTNYPYWDTASQQVITLPLAINECRIRNEEKPLKYKKGKIADLLAYLAYASRGQTVDVKIPDAAALKAYNEGKSLYFARRGQLNFSCASCHMQSAGQRVRTDIMSPALGHTSGWPVYRSKWGELGTLHRRFSGCMKQMRAQPYKAQSVEFRNLEYFLSHMSNDIQYNGPSARK